MPIKTKNKTTNHGTEMVIAAGARMEFHTCGICGITFGMPETFMDQRREDGKRWYCPNEHGWRFSDESEEERLRRELTAERERLERERSRAGRLASNLEQTKAELGGAKAAKTRFRNERDRLRTRAAGGVCPHPGCHRHFENLKRHVAKKHPELLELLRADLDAAEE